MVLRQDKVRVVVIVDQSVVSGVSDVQHHIIIKCFNGDFPTYKYRPVNKVQIFEIFASFADIKTHADHVRKGQSLAARLHICKDITPRYQ